MFLALLKETQARRDEAYTDKGAKKTARGSVFRAAAERLNETRDEKERLQRVVVNSEGAEKQLRDLTNPRTQKQGDLAAAAELVAAWFICADRSALNLPGDLRFDLGHIQRLLSTTPLQSHRRTGNCCRALTASQARRKIYCVFKASERKPKHRSA